MLVDDLLSIVVVPTILCVRGFYVCDSRTSIVLLLRFSLKSSFEVSDVLFKSL
jgi:hypothetical protein